MYSNTFEDAFDRFLNRREYDNAEAALFSIIRIAFTAGWLATGGDPPSEQRIVKTLPREPY